MPPLRPRKSLLATTATAVLSLLLATSSVAAQKRTLIPAPEATAAHSGPNAPAYDVMSIKLNKSGSRSTIIDSEDTHFSATNISLKALLAQAFDLEEELVSGLSGPVQSARFDVEAKLVSPDMDLLKRLTREQSHAMLLPQLIERFKLKTYTEVKTLPVYDLVLTKGGPKFKPSADQTNSNGDMDVNGSRTHATISGKGVTMQALAKALTTRSDRMVIDKTGLSGNFDLKLEWSKEDAANSEPQALPGIFTALQDELGLKLQPAKGPVQTLVVEDAEMPSDN